MYEVIGSNVSEKVKKKIDYAYLWNFPKQAIASPYLTYDQQYRRNHMFAALLHARKVLSLQPECVRFDVYRTAAVLEQNQGSQRANAFIISFCKKALPRLELVAKKYECTGINSNVSAAVFDGHFDSRLTGPLSAVYVVIGLSDEKLLLCFGSRNQCDMLRISVFNPVLAIPDIIGG